MNSQAAHIQAIVKTAPAMAPGAATVTAEWMGVISTGLSIVLISLSIAFLIWRSSFVELWPAGKWGSGSLPSDVKQDLKIERLEHQVDKLITKIYNGK
jgi:hypothetical protein